MQKRLYSWRNLQLKDAQQLREELENLITGRQAKIDQIENDAA